MLFITDHGEGRGKAGAVNADVCNPPKAPIKTRINLYINFMQAQKDCGCHGFRVVEATHLGLRVMLGMI